MRSEHADPLDLVYYGDTILRRQARPVDRLNAETQCLIDRMAATLRAAHGLGLAAPQVGTSQRIVVYDMGQGLVVLVNPVIVAREGEEVMEEGCLSLPHLHGEVPRAATVTVRAKDRQGKRFAKTATGLEARVIQHECDHLAGTLFVDRVRPETVYWAVGEDENGEPYHHATTVEDALRVFESRRQAGPRP